MTDDIYHEYDEDLDIATVFIPEKLSQKNAHQIKTLAHLLSGYNTVVLDFAACDHVDSSGLSATVNMYKLFNSKNNTLVLCSLKEPVKMLMALTNVDSILTIKNTYYDARNYILNLRDPV